MQPERKYRVYNLGSSIEGENLERIKPRRGAGTTGDARWAPNAVDHAGTGHRAPALLFSVYQRPRACFALYLLLAVGVLRRKIFYWSVGYFKSGPLSVLCLCNGRLLVTAQRCAPNRAAVSRWVGYPGGVICVLVMSIFAFRKLSLASLIPCPLPGQ